GHNSKHERADRDRIKSAVDAVAIDNAVLSYFGDGDFSTMFLNLIFLMSYALIPWTAINLVDYYVLRSGQYRVADIFDPDG
ncbi:cytosine permease, partial [Rhizobium ruizarguesonis]